MGNVATAFIENANVVTAINSIIATPPTTQGPKTYGTVTVYYMTGTGIDSAIVASNSSIKVFISVDTVFINNAAFLKYGLTEITLPYRNSTVLMMIWQQVYLYCGMNSSVGDYSFCWTVIGKCESPRPPHPCPPYPQWPCPPQPCPPQWPQWPQWPQHPCPPYPQPGPWCWPYPGPWCPPYPQPSPCQVTPSCSVVNAPCSSGCGPTPPCHDENKYRLVVSKDCRTIATIVGICCSKIPPPPYH